MYDIIEYQDGVVVTANGTEIYRSEEEGYNRNEITDAILDDANFGTPQKQALRAIAGVLEVDHRSDEPMPDR